MVGRFVNDELERILKKAFVACNQELLCILLEEQGFQVSSLPDTSLEHYHCPNPSRILLSLQESYASFAALSQWPLHMELGIMFSSYLTTSVVTSHSLSLRFLKS
jgi:hypothetical protein